MLLQMCFNLMLNYNLLDLYLALCLSIFCYFQLPPLISLICLLLHDLDLLNLFPSLSYFLSFRSILASACRQMLVFLFSQVSLPQPTSDRHTCEKLCLPGRTTCKPSIFLTLCFYFFALVFPFFLLKYHMFSMLGSFLFVGSSSSWAWFHIFIVALKSLAHNLHLSFVGLISWASMFINFGIWITITLIFGYT